MYTVKLNLCVRSRGRTFATGLVAGFGNFLQFLGTKLFLTYVDYLYLSGTFFMYGGKFILIVLFSNTLIYFSLSLFIKLFNNLKDDNNFFYNFL